MLSWKVEVLFRMAALLIFLIFLLLIFFGLPIGFCFGVVSIGSYLALGGNLLAIPQRLFNSIDTFTYLAIPFFVFVGQIMSRGSIAQILVEFCQNIIGNVRGGLALVNVLNSMFFAGLTGSATSDIAGVGKIEAEMMYEAGYDLDFSATVSAASAIIGPIIPPSVIMIVYAVVAGNVSVAAMFLAGVVPGILIGLGEMAVCYIIAKKRNYPITNMPITFKTIFRSFLRSFPVLILPLIILGGTLSGVFTATEASAVAVLYSVILCRYILKSVTWKEVGELLIETVRVTAPVLFIIAAASAMAWVLTILQIPQQAAAFLLQYANSKVVFLLITNVLVLIVGMIMDQAPALLIMVPILSPIATQLGIDPLHYGIVLCINSCIGLLTPPVGMTLFVTSNVTGVKLERLFKTIMPFLAVLLLVLLIITYIPQTVTFIPSLFGY